MNTPICTPDWLSDESIDYIAETLLFCENQQMLADLRKFVPAAALREASKKIPSTNTQQIRVWVQSLNRGQEVAA